MRSSSESPVGAVVISLDFELRWGMHHVLRDGPDPYDACIRNAPEAARLLLDEFVGRRIRATWATVGAVACRGWDDFWMHAPRSPQDADARFATARRFQRLDPTGELHFCRDLVLAIASSATQDLGCHTFSHALCARPGGTADALDRELAACAELWSELTGTGPRSFVYPCDEPAWRDRLRPRGIRVVRTARHHPFGGSRLARKGNAAVSVLCPPRTQIPQPGPDGIIDTEGSCFVRFGLPSPLWRLHVGALRRAIRALPSGRVLHLWWHPHNLGADPRGRVAMLRPLLDEISDGVDRGRLRSLHMADLAAPLP